MITPSFGLTATERVLPRLALDFTTASLDSRITFSRALDTATQINSSGYVSTVNANLPRFDYDPITKICKGLLIEESRINIKLYSQSFNNAGGYAYLAASASPDVINGPDNLLTADKIVEDSSLGFHFFNGESLTLLDNTIYTYSIFLKAAERNWALVGMLDKAGSHKGIYVNLSTGVIGTATPSGGPPVSSSITNYGNGWYRVSISVNSVTGATAPIIRLFLATGDGTANYQGNGTSGIYMWGAQVELGAFPTSYIPNLTTGSTTRNADVATMTGTNFSDWFNASEGSILFEGSRINTTAATGILFQIDDGTATKRISVQANFTPFQQYAVTNTTTQALLIPTGLLTNGVTFRCTSYYKANAFAASTNANAVSTDNSGTVPTVDQARIGNNTNITGSINGFVRKILYWNIKLTDAELQAFSK